MYVAQAAVQQDNTPKVLLKSDLHYCSLVYYRIMLMLPGNDGAGVHGGRKLRRREGDGVSDDGPADLDARIDRLADQLAHAGNLTDPRWRQALHDVPRHLFIPDVALADPNDQEPNEYPVDRAADPERWWAAVYSDTVLVTQVDDGRGDVTAGQGSASSSNSAPGVVVPMLEQLQLHDHHRVLDVGTGTGWTAALLSWRLGAGNVTTVEIDPGLAEQAQKNLQAAGYQPGLATGDGADGYRSGAPYDRVHVTCAVERIPWAWIDQTRPGGVIVTPYTTGYTFGHLARLVVTGRGTAVGRFPWPAGFMMMRSQRHLRGEAAGFIHHESDAGISSTSLDPRTLAWESRSAGLAIGERVPGCQSRLIESTDGTGACSFYLLETRTRGGCWARVDFLPGSSRFPVAQYGPRRLWDEVQEAYSWWVEAGRPERERFGMTVTAEGQWVWLDQPGNRVSKAPDTDRRA
jgi:protein-L-isoaspartate(D-aspartate) O-methyltransferase